MISKVQGISRRSQKIVEFYKLIWTLLKLESSVLLVNFTEISVVWHTEISVVYLQKFLNVTLQKFLFATLQKFL